jgi:hypothetical protein
MTRKLIPLLIAAILISACRWLQPGGVSEELREIISPPQETAQVFVEPGFTVEDITQEDRAGCLPHLDERRIQVIEGSQIPMRFPELLTVARQQIQIEGSGFSPGDPAFITVETRELDGMGSGMSISTSLTANEEGNISFSQGLDIRQQVTEWTAYVKHNDQTMCRKIMVISQFPIP